MQYNGQINDEFRYKWNNYKNNGWKSLKGEAHKTSRIFCSLPNSWPQCFINDTEIRFIDKTDPSEPTRREDFWTDTLKICYPLELNNIDPH